MSTTIDIRLYAAELDGTVIDSAEELGQFVNEWLYKYLERLPEVSAVDIIDVMASTGMLLYDEETGRFLFRIKNTIDVAAY